MNKTELIHVLEETVPPLKEKLHVERVLYRKADNKAYFSFLSDVLVPERDFLTLERRLRVRQRPLATLHSRAGHLESRCCRLWHSLAPPARATAR